MFLFQYYFDKIKTDYGRVAAEGCWVWSWDSSAGSVNVFGSQRINECNFPMSKKL